MEPNGQDTTTAYAAHLRAGVPVIAGAPAWSSNGSHPVANGGNVLSRGIGEQGVGIRVFATGGDV